MRRRFILGYYLNGSLMSADIVHHCMYSCCASYEITIKRLSKHVAWALVPGKPPIFARSRWNRWDVAIDYVGLLAGSHGLLKPLLLKHLKSKGDATSQTQMQTGEPAQPIQTELHNPESDLEELFQEASGRNRSAEPKANKVDETLQHSSLPQETHVEEKNDQKPADTGAETKTFDWAAFNQQKRQEAKEWVKTDPFDRLCCMKEVAAVLMNLMYSFLRYSGHSWEKKQQYLSSKGFERTYVVLEAAKGIEVEKCMRTLFQILCQKPPCVSIQSYDSLLKALRFRMIACGLAALHALLRSPRSKFPFKLFTALQSTEHAQEVLDAPQCSHDYLAHAILAEYEICQHPVRLVC